MTDKSEIVTDESIRLGSLGIPFLFINCYEGHAVSVLDAKTLKTIIQKRNNGIMVSGRFVAMVEPGRWIASYIDDDGIHRHGHNLTESKAYRLVLGYQIGKKTSHTRYAGQPQVRPIRKSKVRRFATP